MTSFTPPFGVGSIGPMEALWLIAIVLAFLRGLFKRGGSGAGSGRQSAPVALRVVLSPLASPCSSSRMRSAIVVSRAVASFLMTRSNGIRLPRSIKLTWVR